MSGIESGAAVLRRAAAAPITSAVGRPSGVDGWLGRRVGEFVLDEGTDAARNIQAYLPQDAANFQYVSDLPSEAVTVARRAAVATRQSQVMLEDARTGAWHVAGLVDEQGAVIRMDELGAIRQSWSDARFDTNHVDAGAVHGEAFDFPLRDDVRRAIDELDLEIAMDDISAVSTDSAQAALTAATRSKITAAAPMRAAALDTLPSQAIEPVAAFGPVDGVPGYLSKTLTTHPRHGEVVADTGNLRAAAGDIDDVRKLARRFSMERGGQQIAVFETAQDHYLLAPLRSYASNKRIVLDEVSDVLRSTPEARLVVGADGGLSSGIRASYAGASATLDPAAAADRMRLLQRSIDQMSDSSIVSIRSKLASQDARLAAIESELQGAGFRERGALKRERRDLVSARAATERTEQSRSREYHDARTALTKELDQLTTFVERYQLPEREEWVALAGYVDGTPRLRELRQVEAGVSYEDLVRTARETSFRSESSAGVVLRANDGALWTGTYDITPDQLLEMQQLGPAYRGSMSARPTDAMRAASVGGRTVQWDQAGQATLA